MSTLHLTDASTAIHAEQCVHATPRSPADDPDVIVVSLVGSPITWFAQWDRVVGADDRAATFVVDESADWSAGDPRERVAAVADADVTVETVASPGNLTDLGVTLTAALDAHRARETPTVLCFQSLTVLLQYSDAETVFRFLHTLVGHLDQAGATAHFHLHEPAHESETVDRLRPLFDRVRRDATGRNP